MGIVSFAPPVLSPTEPMPPIHQLSQSMINKIAAGEVVERPASVVKELLEKSLDAGARRVDIAVEKGGIERIRIVDDGCGIAREQLSLALSPHATSKVAETDDLFRIKTFGFRGEALASIAEISQLVLRSRIADCPEGAELRSDGGSFSDIAPCGMPVGTLIEVDNLFFNTPVRRKYMRSVPTEFGHVLETFLRSALPQLGIHFTFRHNDKIVHELPPETDGIERIRKLFGAEIADNLIYVESRRGEISVFGYVGHPKISRSNNRMQYFFLNGRSIRDRALQHALSEAFRGVLTVGRFPIAFLQIEMSPELFDVNVHPTKMEVRFLDSNKVYSHFLGAIRERFLSVDLHSKISAGELAKKPDFSRPDRSKFGADPAYTKSSLTPENTDPRKAIDEETLDERRRRIVDWAKGRLQEKEDDLIAKKQAEELGITAKEPFDVNRALEESFARDTLFEEPTPRPKPLGLHEISADKIPAARMPVPPAKPASSPFAAREPGGFAASPPEFAPPAFAAPGFSSPEKRAFLQIHNRYLVRETPEGLAIIDQHALHERILYEQLKNRFAAGRIDSQRLLVPIPIDLTPSEAACVRENLELFSQLGLAVEPFGGDTVLISGYPAPLEKIDPQDLLLGLVDTLLDSSKKPNRADLLEEMLHQMSCKAAVKAGDRLRDDAIEELLSLAEQEQNSHHCPHGRPSTLEFSCTELDKMFKRG